jgi:hypothetical protein
MMRHSLLLALVGLLNAPAFAETPQAILDTLSREAGGASATQGEKFFRAKSNAGSEAEACASCHTDDARARGRHVKTHKEIEPLAPVANKERFTDPAKVEKWFRRNCKEVLGRACTPREKADFAAYIIGLK